jgi:predicted ATPase
MIKTAVLWRRWSEAYETPNADTLRLLHKAAEDYWSGGAGNYKPFFLTLIAEVAFAAGQTETAQKLSEEALTRLEKTNERWAQAETERIRALAVRDRDEAETRLLKAMHTAHSQSAIMFELRSAVSLLRMGIQEAVRLETGDAVRDLLKSIKGGHETEDIQSALSACEVICPAKTAPHRKGQEAAS